MHIADGILPLPVVAGGMAIMAAGVAFGMRKLDLEAIPKTGVVTAGLFVASLVHIPVGPGSVHPLMIGAAGILLGWPVFPAYLIALLLQVLFFGFGGLFMLGVNTVIMAGPALAMHYAFRLSYSPAQGPRAFMIMSGLWGGAGILLSGLTAMTVLLTAGRTYAATAQWILAAHIPVMIGEAFITAALLHFVRQVRPDLLPPPLYRGHATGQEVCELFVAQRYAFSLAWIAGLLLLCGVAAAHAVQLFVYVDGPVVKGVATYFGGAPVKANAIVVSSAGSEVARVQTDDEGRFTYTPTKPADYVFTLETVDGHRVEYEIKAEWLATLGASGPATANPAPDNSADLARIEARIDHLEHALRLRDVLGGLGYIVGVMGLLFWWKARQQMKG